MGWAFPTQCMISFHPPNFTSYSEENQLWLVKEFGDLHVTTWQIGDSKPWLIPPTQIPFKDSRAWETEFSKSYCPFCPAAPSIQAEVAMVLSVVLNIITYTGYEGLREWKFRASLESTIAFFLPLNLQRKLCNWPVQFALTFSQSALYNRTCFKHQFWEWKTDFLYVKYFIHNLLPIVSKINTNYLPWE